MCSFGVVKRILTYSHLLSCQYRVNSAETEVTEGTITGQKALSVSDLFIRNGYMSKLDRDSFNVLTTSNPNKIFDITHRCFGTGSDYIY